MKVYGKNSVKNIGWNVEDFLPSPEHGNRKGKKNSGLYIVFVLQIIILNVYNAILELN